MNENSNQADSKLLVAFWLVGVPAFWLVGLYALGVL